MSRFWIKSEEKVQIPSEPSLTFMLVHDAASDSIKKVCLELMDNPLLGLDFTDFKLSECIRHGISYKALNISPDMRNGHDAEFDLLESRFSDLEKDIFVQSENK